MTQLFIDVSHHDRDRRGAPLDWAAIRTAGLGTAMIARATYGDPQGFNPTTRFFAEIQAGAKAAGYVARGGYHNLIHGDTTSINRQVDYLRAQLDTTGATFGMADIEPYDELKANGLWPRWTDVTRFHDRWYSLEQRVMVWYIGRWVWRDWLTQPVLSQLKGPLINANYPGGDGTAAVIYTGSGADTGPGWTSYGGRTPDVWQFTSIANVPGASNTTDCNAFRGTADQLAALLNGDPVALTPQDIDAIADAVVTHKLGNSLVDTVGIALQSGLSLAKDTNGDVQTLIGRPVATIDTDAITQAVAAAVGTGIAPVIARIDILEARLAAGAKAASDALNT